MMEVKRSKMLTFQAFIKMPTGGTVLIKVDRCMKVEDLLPREISDAARCYITYQRRVLPGNKLCKKYLKPDCVVTLRCGIAGGMFNNGDD